MTHYGMTKRQHELLNFIEHFTDEFGYPPSFQEMVGALGLKSKSGVHRLLHGLRERGLVKMMDHRARSVVSQRQAA